MKSSFGPHPITIVEHDSKFWVCNVPHTIKYDPVSGPTCGGFVNIPFSNLEDAQVMASRSRQSTEHIFKVWNDYSQNSSSLRRDRDYVSCT